MLDLDALVELVAGSTATSEDGIHLVQMDRSKFIRSEGKLRSAHQASGYLRTGEWEPVTPTCGVEHCVLPTHLEEAELVMVAQASAPTLASLYRKAKSRGLVTTTSGYGG
jgi:hypothetical protein